jgi:hypothetical protein
VLDIRASLYDQCGGLAAFLPALDPDDYAMAQNWLRRCGTVDLKG